jgi:hypothetical protein
MTNVWILVIFGVNNSATPMQMLSDIASERECVRVKQVMDKTLPAWFSTRCVEVIKKETK